MTPLRPGRRSAGRTARRVLARVVARVGAGLVRRDRGLEFGLCLALLPDRLQLPEVSPSALLPGFDDLPVAVQTVPLHPFAAQVQDVVVLTRIAALSGAARILELGSFDGATALTLASNLPEPTRVVTVDIDPDHGSAYAASPLATRIERRVGRIGRELFTADEQASYDLIFIDADHRREAVRSDTEIALELLAPDGWLLWHDYANWGWFDGGCGVPEYLHELAGELPLVQLAGTYLAAHRPAWAHDERARYDAAVRGRR